MRRADSLKVGDSFLYGLSSPIRTTVLRPAEPTTDRFGQTMFRLWCKREDTGEEGYCTFGPEGRVRDAAE